MLRSALIIACASVLVLGLTVGLVAALVWHRIPAASKFPALPRL